MTLRLLFLQDFGVR